MTIRRNYRNTPSLAARLILGLTLGTTVLWCGAATYSTYLSYRELNEAFDRALQETARRLLPLAADDVMGHESDDDGRAIRYLMKGSEGYLSYQLRDHSGRIVLRSHDAPEEPYDRIADPGFVTVGNYRLFTDTDETTGLTIMVAETARGRFEAVLGAAKAMLWPLAGLIPLNGLFIWIIVRGAMRPVLRLSQDIAARDGVNLAPLDISDQPGELRPIAEAVARLVDRLRAALDAERAFAANSAHELRTPIAGALAQTQRMIARSNDPEDRRRAREVEGTLKRLSRLSEKLLQISRIDAGVGIGDSDVDLLPILDLVVSDCAKRLEEPCRIHYEKSKGATLVARMDIDAFAIVVRNLIDNAIIHGVANGQIEVLVAPEGTVRIINDAPLVPPDVLAKLKHRFARGETRSEGSGLGLAIAETIVNQTGGTLELFSPAHGRIDGFEARLIVRGERPAS